jgi:opacity protein-like surface antigen
MTLRTSFCTAAAVLSFVATSSAQARDCTIAETVFTDGLYGMGAGLIVGALWMTANAQNTQGSDVVPTLATGALIGGGVGAVLGIVEVGLCINDRKSSSPLPKLGFQTPSPVFLTAKNPASFDAGLGMNFKYVLK